MAGLSPVRLKEITDAYASSRVASPVRHFQPQQFGTAGQGQAKVRGAVYNPTLVGTTPKVQFSPNFKFSQGVQFAPDFKFSHFGEVKPVTRNPVPAKPSAFGPINMPNKPTPPSTLGPMKIANFSSKYKQVEPTSLKEKARKVAGHANTVIKAKPVKLRGSYHAGKNASVLKAATGAA